jgi:hypothetical protein
MKKHINILTIAMLLFVLSACGGTVAGGVCVICNEEGNLCRGCNWCIECDPYDRCAECKYGEDCCKCEETTPVQETERVSREWENALRSGRDYLRIMSFSHSSLSSQLEFEGYPQEAIEWAMKQIDNETDWAEQAVSSAESYLDLMSFSRSGLVDQLVFEGFSREDAEYAAKRVFD